MEDKEIAVISPEEYKRIAILPVIEAVQQYLICNDVFVSGLMISPATTLINHSASLIQHEEMVKLWFRAFFGEDVFTHIPKNVEKLFSDRIEVLSPEELVHELETAEESFWKNYLGQTPCFGRNGMMEDAVEIWKFKGLATVIQKLKETLEVLERKRPCLERWYQQHYDETPNSL